MLDQKQRQQRQDEQTRQEEELIEGASELRQEANSVDVRVRDYKAHGTDQCHGHDREKHDARQALGVTDELVENFFWSDPTDHAAPHELLARKKEFVESDTQVFKDVDDTSQKRWEKVERAAGNAPISDEAHRKLEEIASM